MQRKTIPQIDKVKGQDREALINSLSLILQAELNNGEDLYDYYGARFPKEQVRKLEFRSIKTLVTSIVQNLNNGTLHSDRGNLGLIYKYMQEIGLLVPKERYSSDYIFSSRTINTLLADHDLLDQQEAPEGFILVAEKQEEPARVLVYSQSTEMLLQGQRYSIDNPISSIDQLVNSVLAVSARSSIRKALPLITLTIDYDLNFHKNFKYFIERVVQEGKSVKLCFYFSINGEKI